MLVCVHAYSEYSIGIIPKDIRIERGFRKLNLIMRNSKTDFFFLLSFYFPCSRWHPQSFHGTIFPALENVVFSMSQLVLGNYFVQIYKQSFWYNEKKHKTSKGKREKIPLFHVRYHYILKGLSVGRKNWKNIILGKMSSSLCDHLSPISWYSCLISSAWEWTRPVTSFSTLESMEVTGYVITVHELAAVVLLEHFARRHFLLCSLWRSQLPYWELADGENHWWESQKILCSLDRKNGNPRFASLPKGMNSATIHMS